MNIKLPKLERIVFKESGNKNTIIQLLAPAFEISLDNITHNPTYAMVQFDGIEILFVNKIENIPLPDDPEELQSFLTSSYILLTNNAPSKTNFDSGKISIKKWLRHPKFSSNNNSEVLSNWKNKFFYKEEDSSQNIKGLRQPQLGALHMIMGHLILPMDTGTVVLPTGTGKTETMLSALIAHQCEKLLVTVPSDSLRSQIGGKFSTLGLLKEFGIIADDALYPIVGIIHEGFKSLESLKTFFSECNVIVTTMSILTSCPQEFQQEIATICSNIFIDEAHHVKAASWNAFKEQFPADKVLQFTATPFRNDGQRLDGKIIFNFPLKNAQEQGYFKKIDFLPIREYDTDKADRLISDLAVKRLREDISNGYNHILMARCGTKERARAIFELYKTHQDLNPVLLYSNVPGFQDTYAQIIKKESKIIVCVDMLGEGFDLPELKIAAFHDIRKSLPITLQFAGRFTRTKHDENLGAASFIANIADLDVRSELADLYAHDADWNQILSDSSFGRIKDEEEYKDLMSGFANLNKSKIPFQNIKPKLSAVVYKNKTDEWFPLNFTEGIQGYDELEYKFFDINRDEKILIIITAKREYLDWINTKDIYLINWDVTLVYWETKNNLLFINSSDNGSVYADLAKAIIGDKAELIRGINVFRAFANIKRTKLQNVGLRYFLGKNERFRMSVGSDVAEALSIAERQKGEKAFVMGVGFENGDPVNLGASYKGRIWTKLAGDIMRFKKWCIHIGNKLVDEKIDPNQILRETLIPEQRTIIPDIFPVWIDWDVDMYLSTENRFKFSIDGFASDMSNMDLCLENPTMGGPLLFSLNTELRKAIFEIKLFENNSDPENAFPDFSVTLISKEKVEVQFGTKTMDATKFFEEYVPTIWFADGSALTGNDYVELKQTISHYPKTEIIAWDWTGVDLSKEAQGIEPKITDSIQFKVIETLKATDVDIIYDDDYSGEIADIVTLKLLPDKIKVDLYHLKFALDGKVSKQIKNFYEVCGQAQKSVHWKHKDGTEFINHLLRRQTKERKGKFCSRLERGTSNDLERLLTIVKKEIPVEFEIFIVQPGASQSTITDDILTLLGVTENFIKEIGGINLKVIISP
jgi:superfamily II DNA or RNA helicase